jgi:hypothetical protein
LDFCQNPGGGTPAGGAACQPQLPQPIVTLMVGTLKLGRVRFRSLARRGIPVLLTSGMLAGLAAAPVPALPAFDITPASLTLQAGDSATGTLSNLPVGNEGEAGCLEAASGTSVYLSVVFSTVCGGQQGWSSSMTIRTIPATPAGTSTIVIQVCPNEACSIPDIRNVPPIDSRNLTVVVTPASVPVETVPFPPSTSPAPPPSQTPHGPPTPSRSVPRTVLPTATGLSGIPAPTVAPTTPAPSLSPGPSPAAAGAAAPSLVLDHPVLTAGQTVRISGTGCVPGAPATVALPGSVTGTTTAGPAGAFQISLRVPPSLGAGRYPVVAQCGTTLSSFVDVQWPRSIRTAVLVAVAVVAILLAAAAVVVWRKPRHPAAS